MTETPLRVAMINSDGKASPPLADPDGIVTTMYELRFRVMARTPYDHLFTELGTVAAAEAAIADGCDAIYIDTFGDYGLARIRAATSLPVIGAGEASLASAAQRLGTFSVVTVWPRSMAYLYDERLENSMGGHGCGGVHFLSDETELERVGTSHGVQARMVRREDQIVGRLAELCASAVAHDRTAGVLLGCTCMSPVADQLQQDCEFQVLDPSRLGLQTAFDAAGKPAARPTAGSQNRGLATEMVDTYLEHGHPGTTFHDCEVCTIVSS